MTRRIKLSVLAACCAVLISARTRASDTIEDIQFVSAVSFENAAQNPFRALLRRPAVVLAPIPVRVEEEPLPPDLADAGRSWGTESQIARIAPVSAGGTFRFVVLGDVEPGRFIWERLPFGEPGVFKRELGLIKGESASFIMQLGDMVSRGTAGNYRSFFSDLDQAGLRTPYLTALGNHDRRWPHGDADAGLYNGIFGAGDYFFDLGGYRFVVLDSSRRDLTEGQLSWLDHALDTPLKTVVFTHMPPLGLLRWTWGIAGIREGGEKFAEIAKRRGVSRVYVGHIHAFGAADHEGVRYVLSGGGGSPLYPIPVKGFYHYIVVEAGPDGLKETVHALDGTTFQIPWAR